jgi:hypothetical protein
MIAYKNGNRLDCRLENLEYRLTQENAAALERGKYVAVGITKPRKKRFTSEEIIHIRSSSLRGSVLAKQYGVHESLVSLIRAHKRYTESASISRIGQRLFSEVLYDLDTAAKMIGCKPNTLLIRCMYDRVKCPKFEHIKIAGKYFLPGHEVDRIIRDRLLQRKQPIKYNGKYYDSIQEAAEENGVHPETLRQRLMRLRSKPDAP